ncbi:uncharacterized protein LOC132299470 isoform X3 [Cornus florida]|uniref:uncharacterized protein LOC132299470 isoform X3 n=1 Tax=Cornus florida TaxID=4283 RepID=UPI00289AB2E2|nr:uncharacterized protein LOC132299470 isoform X3 [Cornus florida]
MDATYVASILQSTKQFQYFCEVINHLILKRIFLRQLQLIELPKELGKMESSKILLADGTAISCSKLIELPKELGKMESLKIFVADGTAISCSKLIELPKELGKKESWKILLADGTAISCSKLIELPKELGKMESLQIRLADGTAINLSFSTTEERFSYFCLSDDAILRDLGRLSLLKELNLSGNPISSLPESIKKGLNMLKSLKLRHCRKLRSLPELPMTINYLDLRNCRSMEMVANLPNMLSSLLFIMHGCSKLVQVQGVFKLEPIGTVDAEMVNILGLSIFELLGNVKVNLYNNMTFTERKVRLQGLYEFGMFSTFVPGNEVPVTFSSKSTGSSICFNVPSIPNLKIRGLNVCVVYANAGRHSSYMREMYWNMLYITTSNETKELKWKYSPTFVGIPDDNKYMIWLCHWKLGNTLEVGDAVKVSVDSGDYFKIKEFGIDVVYEQKENGISNNACVCCQEEVNNGALLAYHLSGDFLCNFVHQKRFTDFDATSGAKAMDITEIEE